MLEYRHGWQWYLSPTQKKPFVRDSEPETDETEPDQDSGSDVSLPLARKHCRATSRPSFLVPKIDADVELTFEGNVVVFISPLEHKNQAFALFSAIKRIVGRSRKKHSLPATISPCTHIGEKPLGLRNSKFQRSWLLKCCKSRGTQMVQI